MGVREQFNFDDIICPNSFEDDPWLDTFFDRLIQPPARERLQKHHRNLSTCEFTKKIRNVAMSELVKSTTPKKPHTNFDKKKLCRAQEKSGTDESKTEIKARS